MKSQLTEGEFNLLLGARQSMQAMIEQIDDYKVFTEDPTNLYEELEYCVTELEKRVSMLIRVNNGLKERDLR